GDLERLTARAAQGFASARELVALRRSLETLPAVVATLAGAGSLALRDLAGRVVAAPELAALPAPAPGEDPPPHSRDGGAIRRGWTRPGVNEGVRLEIAGGRHPLVEAALPEGVFVPNDLVLDPDAEQVVILTGPNMAGKSTYLRQAALITLLAQAGSFVPATSV